ncbi:hypothetical protein CU098_007151 [Rhizopus stolonifer]|uniref:DNA recombination and repair protein Rad51-like C-terminal domain-containing protein n=1 Tax=Rhizopus stolonifer TaxID=4846 RepID=A0A367K4B3_RHIST|nr:hypothetical protein CU098_007151 [Rhizopus stolonifer]
MPFLINFISDIKHQSLLEYSAQVENQAFDLPVCISAINTSVEACQEIKKGVSPGDAIELVGASEAAKTWIMTQLAKYTLEKTHSHVLYIDLDGHFLMKQAEPRFHLFQPTSDRLQAFISSLDTWFEKNIHCHVLWVFVDGRYHFMTQLRELQQKWAFVLMTTTSLMADYKFQVNHDPLSIQLVWPMQLDVMLV